MPIDIHHATIVKMIINIQSTFVTGYWNNIKSTLLLLQISCGRMKLVLHITGSSKVTTPLLDRSTELFNPLICESMGLHTRVSNFWTLSVTPVPYGIFILAIFLSCSDFLRRHTLICNMGLMVPAWWSSVAFQLFCMSSLKYGTNRSLNWTCTCSCVALMIKLDSFLWGHLKELAYWIQVTSENDLVSRMHFVLIFVDSAMLDHVQLVILWWTHVWLDVSFISLASFFFQKLRIQARNFESISF